MPPADSPQSYCWGSGVRAPSTREKINRLIENSGSRHASAVVSLADASGRPDRGPRRRACPTAAVAVVDGACAFIPYALVALVLRLVMTRLSFLDGQTRL
jgi:hypothetical protein